MLTSMGVQLHRCTYIGTHEPFAADESYDHAKMNAWGLQVWGFTWRPLAAIALLSTVLLVLKWDC